MDFQTKTKTNRNNQHLDLDKLRKLEEYFSQADPSNQRVNENYDIEIEDLDNSPLWDEWLRKKQEGTNLDPKKQRVPLQESPQSDYQIELTRLREPNTPSSLSNLTVPDVDISSIYSVALSPSQPRRSAALTPRRSNGLRNTPRGILQQKQIEQIERANPNRVQQRTDPEEGFQPTASSTPCKQLPKKNLLSKLSLGVPQNNDVNVNQISSSDEQRSIPTNITNRNGQTTENGKSVSDKTAVEPVSTSQHDKTIVPCTQEQPNAIQSNEDEEIIPESQDTEDEPSISNPVQAPVKNSLRGSQQQQTNEKRAESNGMRTPPNSATGVPPAWALQPLSTPKSANNQSSRLPFLRKTPQADMTVDKRSSVAAQEIATSNVLESTPTKSNRNNSIGQTLVVAVTTPSALRAPPAVAMPNIQLNVNINGAMQQSPHQNSADKNGTASHTVQLDQQPSTNNVSNESLMTNDSDPLLGEAGKENRVIKTLSLDHTEHISARRQLTRSFGATEVRRERQPIDNRTHSINNESAIGTSQRKSKRSTIGHPVGIDSIRSNGSNILPPIDSRTFDKQQSNVGNATYDISKHGVSTRASMNTFTKDLHNVSRRRTIDVTDATPLISTVVDLTIDSIDSSYDTDDADAEVARVTGPPKINGSNGSSNHSADSSDRDEVLELSEDSDHQSGTPTEGTQTQMEQNNAENIQNEIQKGKIPAAFDPVVVIKQLPADKLVQSRLSTNGTQQEINIRESESFSHMIPPIDFRDEPIIRDRSPESARREFSIEQTKPVSLRRSSNSKRRKTSINPELEVINQIHKEIHQPRKSSPKRSSNGRKLFSHQNEDVDLVDSVSTNSKASTSTSSSQDSAPVDVFKKPSAPPLKRSKLSLRSSKTSSANQSLNPTITSQNDHEQSATNSSHSNSTGRPTEEEGADQMNVDAPMEFETEPVQHSSKRPEKKTKTISKAKANRLTRDNISSSNIIEDDDGDRKSGRKKRQPNITCMRTQSIERLKEFHDLSHKRKLSHAPSTTLPQKRPKLSENRSSRSEPSRSKSSKKHANPTPTEPKERFKQGLTEEYINEHILQKPWWKNLCDMKKRKMNRKAGEEDVYQRKVQEGKRIESVSLNSLEFQSVSDGFDIAIIPSERENRIHGYMRLQPSATKEAATVEHDTHFYIFNGEISLNADSETWELIGGDTFNVKAGIDYEIQNVGEDVCVINFIYHTE